ncbi:MULTISPECIES: electron transfer flavoprotein subunit alpha/FixB family protein [Allobacillus]|uniref:Electron transfer flavoprotein subunit alpha/FixB family protein n=1 Tax=Allobacillus halotolerans TaxID=570278 RepID=A0ABS6GM16_9BACI|nr:MULTISPECIES: electron transfer flavoprotein subunit alpha/FixB family protein [Allobacillus]MBU6080161.1 electron transfer flavoprotein subunit alpha/FixB family protein [Allobacillus halotolerans]TSJ68368.1 electron transfer flavoprotein subunit alpha/FixB family protein [Allobacillus sp. SKP2-8]
MGKFLVISEVRDGELRNVSFENIAAARQIDENGEVVAAVLGDGDLESLGQELIQYGADRAVVVQHENLKNYTSDGYVQAAMAVIEQEDPDGIVMGHTSEGKDLSPRIASKLDSGLISDVTQIEGSGDDVKFIRPIYSGKAFEKKVITNGKTFITIRPNNIAPPEKDESRSGDVQKVEVDVQNLRTVIQEVIRKASEGVDLSEANIIVAGGRGVKSAEGFDPLYELADALGGAVGASRGAADAGYCDYSLQIGQTGKVVTPDLYIAVGISGAIQHLAGMSNSKVIVAINKDPEANIFNVADYGIVGDLFEVVPALTEEIKALKG